MRLGASEAANWVKLLQPLADDEWIVAHRGSEWLGLAPDLEEDLALSSINQDEMGHAYFYYTLLTELGEQSPEHLVFRRTASQWRHARILERPNGDWAQMVAVRYFYDVLDDMRLEALSQVSWQPLQDGVRKIRREESYHLEHFSTWFEMLATGTDESRRRLLRAILETWPHLGDLFSWGSSDAFLMTLGLDPLRPPVLQRAWEDRVARKLETLDISWPGSVPPLAADGRKGEHTDDFAHLLAVMTEVESSEQTAQW